MGLISQLLFSIIVILPGMYKGLILEYVKNPFGTKNLGCVQEKRNLHIFVYAGNFQTEKIIL